MKKEEYFQEVLMPIKELPIRIWCFCGRENHPGYPFHWHRDAEILYCMKGIMHVQINNRKYKLTEGKVLWINSNEVHTTYTEPNSEILALQISHDFLSSLTQQLYFYVDENKLFNDENIKEISTLLLQMYAHFNINEKGVKLKILSLLYEFCYLMVRDYQRIGNYGNVTTQKKMELLHNICNYIYNHQTEPLSLAHLSEVFSYTPQYISNVFKSGLNITFNDYLNSIRVDTSLDYLLNSDYSLSQIAEKCGFASARSFNKAFKDIYGMLPKEYKNKDDYIVNKGLKYKII